MSPRLADTISLPAPGTRSVPFVAARTQRRAPVLDGSLAYKGLDTLLDRLRGVESSRATRRVVFAGAAPGESVHLLVEGLATRAASRGVKALALTLKQSSGKAVLSAATASEALILDLGADATSKLDGWLERIAPDASLALIETPSPGDASLFARAGDGLVIVMHAGRTDRKALQAAAESARATGCQTLGIVVQGSLDPLPEWLSRVFSS